MNYKHYLLSDSNGPFAIINRERYKINAAAYQAIWDRFNVKGVTEFEFPEIEFVIWELPFTHVHSLTVLCNQKETEKITITPIICY